MAGRNKLLIDIFQFSKKFFFLFIVLLIAIVSKYAHGQNLAPSLTNPSLAPALSSNIKTILQAPETIKTVVTPQGNTLTVRSRKFLLPPGHIFLRNLPIGIYVSWHPPRHEKKISYNVYRTTIPGADYRRINAQPVTQNFFLDGAHSLHPPQNHQIYFYAIESVNKQGHESGLSYEMVIKTRNLHLSRAISPAMLARMISNSNWKAPHESLNLLNLPANGAINLSLPEESKLSIQGYKKISTQINWQKYYVSAINGVSPNNTTTNVDQELVLNLNGEIGKNVDVHVNYSDVNRTGTLSSSNQQISLAYHGNPNSAIQEVAFGDLTMGFENTQFAGFNQQLFGLKAKAKAGPLHVKAFFAQTTGQVATQTFTGNLVQQSVTILDTSYVQGKYYLITKQFISGPVAGENYALPENGSEQIYVSSGNSVSITGGSNYIGTFQHYLPGVDYTINYSTGVITFSQPIQPNQEVAVGFIQKNGTPVGLTPTGQINLDPATLNVPSDGIITNAAHLLKQNTNPAEVSPLYLMNYYFLGTAPIIPPLEDPNFIFQIINQGTNAVVESNTTPNPRWTFQINTNLNLLIIDDTTNTVYPERPFANPDGGTSSGDVYSQTTTPNSLYRIYMQYETQVNFFQLNQINIIPYSEAVFLDGRRLIRNVDYYIDYTTGLLSFANPSMIQPNSQIVVTYEYSPFGSSAQSNIFGAQLQLDLTQNLKVGSTVLYNSGTQPTEIPQIGSTPNSLSLLDANLSYNLFPKDYFSITRLIPGLGRWKPPIKTQITAEIAQSQFSPNTYSMDGESGVAMIDSMQGIDTTVGPSIDPNPWIVSSAPLPVPFLNEVNYYAGPGASNNRIRFRNGPEIFGENLPNQNGGELYSITGNPSDAVPTLQFPYADLTNQRWGGLRQVLSPTGMDISSSKYLEAWVYNDGVNKWIMFDFGIISEDSTGTGNFYYPATPQVPYQNTGIPTYYFTNPNTPTTGPADETGATQEGRNDGIYDTEDINGNNELDTTNSYFEFGIEASWKGWQLIKIPINFSSPAETATTSTGINYFFYPVNSPSPQNVQAVRIWVTGTSSTPASGMFLLQSVELVYNQWQLEVGATAASQGAQINPNKFNVSTIDQEDDPSYSPDLNFITIQPTQNQNTVDTTQQALKIDYQLSSEDYYPTGDVGGHPIYMATRFFGTPMDFTNYLYLALDLQAKNFRPGDILFIRLQNDASDYFQYNFPITSADLNTWQTLSTPIDGSGGNRDQVGQPFLNQITQISIGVLSPSQPDGITDELWLTNLRVYGSNNRIGGAQRLDTTSIVGNNFMTVNTRYQEEDAGFSEMDQTSTRFQETKDIGFDLSSSGIKLFSQPVFTDISFSSDQRLTPDSLKNNPFYENLSNYSSSSLIGKISYNGLTLPIGLGQISNIQISGTTDTQANTYLPSYASQLGVQGNNDQGETSYSWTGTYHAPPVFLGLPLGMNQVIEGYSYSRDFENFNNPEYYNYMRQTTIQSYAWTNSTPIFKNLTITPGYTWSLTEAQGNTNFAGQAGFVNNYVIFQKQMQPTLGVIFQAIPGVVYSGNYTGLNNQNYAQTPESQYTISNSLNNTLTFSPGVWLPFFQKIGLSGSFERSDSSNASILNFSSLAPLQFSQAWGFNTPNNFAYTDNRTISDQASLNANPLSVLSLQSNVSWNNQISVLSPGAAPVQQLGETVGISSIWNQAIVHFPILNFEIDLLQLQYTLNTSTQYDASFPPQIVNQTVSDGYGITVPYDINHHEAQGRILYQLTEGYALNRGIITTTQDYQTTLEYDQNFSGTKIIGIPFTNLHIELVNAIEMQILLSTNFSRGQSSYFYDEVYSDTYTANLNLNYDVISNILFGLQLARTEYLNFLIPTESYNLYQATISIEAKF